MTITDAELAAKYRPLLVLFPEIADGSRRPEHHHEMGDRPGRPPLDRDYHPRDIRLVLDHAGLPGGGKTGREQLLRAMSDNSIDHIDLIDGGGPKDVDKFWREYAGVVDKDASPDYRRTAYARVVRGEGWFAGYTSIQYWLAYLFDDWANVHEMDWEMVSVILKQTGGAEKPVACVYNAHIGAFRLPWRDVHRADDAGRRDAAGHHAVAYIANGSHAAYFSDYPPYFSVAAPYLKGALRTVVRITGIARPFTDYVPRFEEGARVFPEVAVIPPPDGEGRWAGDWRWLNFRGRWGSPVEMTLWERLINRALPLLGRLPMFFKRPLREAGPRGPNTRGTCWERPFDWANLECLDAPPVTPWLDGVSRDTP